MHPNLTLTGWPARRHVRRGFVEALLVLGAFGLYNLGRVLAVSGRPRADGDARHVLAVERWLHLPTEAWAQDLVLPHPALLWFADHYYEFVHFPLTAGVLVWLYRHRPAAYEWAKYALLIGTGLGLLVHIAFPVTPPRLMPSLHMVDTGVQSGSSVYQAPVLSSLSNQYAAMPSLHVGWAFLLAVVMIAATRGRWRPLWLLHPLVTLAVVVVTANHYWLDAVVGVAFVGVGLVLGAGAVAGREWDRPARVVPV
ncbi:phosphatase PAP2 family protein [Spongisporangium articulatum]|uniref:Phosphatase PAP2 family protein n=1 Tax=Spongisporangium articulatum TaxID=3362603 RepID=A0ABW8AM34_9ACTN